jgi:hypothetical protein
MIQRFPYTIAPVVQTGGEIGLTPHAEAELEKRTRMFANTDRKPVGNL